VSSSSIGSMSLTISPLAVCTSVGSSSRSCLTGKGFKVKSSIVTRSLISATFEYNTPGFRIFKSNKRGLACVPISHKSLKPFVVRRANLSPLLSSNALEQELGQGTQQEEDKLKLTLWTQWSQLGSIRWSCHLLAYLLEPPSQLIFQGPVGLLLLVHLCNFRDPLKEVSRRCRLYLEQKPRRRKMYRLDLESGSQFREAIFSFGSIPMVILTLSGLGDWSVALEISQRITAKE
jgi:hypothetical protein